MNKYLCKIHLSTMPANGFYQMMVWADSESDALLVVKCIICVDGEGTTYTITPQ